jgi:hypothetical protein
MMDARAMQSLAVDYAIQESLFGHELYAPRSAALHPRLWRRRGLVPLHLVDDRQPLPPTESWKRRSASRYRLLVGDVTIHLPFLPGEGPGGELHLYADDQDPNTFYVLTPEESARWSGPDR